MSHPHGEIVRRVGLVLATLTVSAGFFAALVGSANASAFANRYGMEFLQYGSCCGGDTLFGTKASIIPNHVNPGGTYCTLFRSDAEDNTGGYLIQAGVVKCGSQTDLDGTCSLTNNLVKFVETETPSGGYVCHPHGGTSVGTEVDAAVYGYAEAFDNGWNAYLNGTPEEGIPVMTGAQYIVEGAEHAGTDSCNSSDWGGTNDATFASATPVWQRYKTNLTWYTVQGSSTSSGCWTVSGGPPNSFTISFG